MMLVGDLNAWLSQPRYQQEEDLETFIANHGISDHSLYFILRRRYRWGGSLIMEDVEKLETYLWQRGLHSRHRLQVFLQCWYYRTKNVNRSLDDTGQTQGGWVQEELKVLQGTVHLSHCSNKVGSNSGGRFTFH